MIAKERPRLRDVRPELRALPAGTVARVHWPPPEWTTGRAGSAGFALVECLAGARGHAHYRTIGHRTIVDFRVDISADDLWLVVLSPDEAARELALAALNPALYEAEVMKEVFDAA